MTISPDDLKKALGLVMTAKRERKTIDLAKVASALVDATHEALSGEGDPETKIDGLVEKVDKIAAILDAATTDQDGRVSIGTDDEIAKFDIFESAPGESEGGDAPAPDAAPASDPPAAPPPPADAGTDGGLGEEAAEDVDKWDDDDQWDEDMAPTVPPLLKSERMTRRERPVPARQGALADVKKRYDDRRNKVFERGERCMS